MCFLSMLVLLAVPSLSSMSYVLEIEVNNQEGTWEVDRRAHRFPRGLRAISDYAHSKDVNVMKVK